MNEPTKSEHQRSVEKFMVSAKQIVRDRPTWTIPDTEVILSAKMLFEECFETIMNGLGIEMRVYNSEGHPFSVPISKNNVRFFITQPQNVVEVMDGTSDVHVIATGIASRYGVNETPIVEMVDQNNLEKFGPGHYIREDGKLVKPPGHNPPDIKKELDRQLALAEAKP